MKALLGAGAACPRVTEEKIRTNNPIYSTSVESGVRIEWPIWSWAQSFILICHPQRYKMRGCSTFFLHVSRSASDSWGFLKILPEMLKTSQSFPGALLLLAPWEMCYKGMNPPGWAPNTARIKFDLSPSLSSAHQGTALESLGPFFLFFFFIPQMWNGCKKNQSHWVNKMRRKITEVSWQRGGRHPTRGASTTRSRKETKMDVSKET